MRVSAFFIVALAALFALGMAALVVSLYRLQVGEAAGFGRSMENQSTRRICIPSRRGRILDRNGGVLADLSPELDIVCRMECFGDADAAEAALDRLAAAIRLERTVGRDRIVRHLRESGVLPLAVWRNVDEAVLARFSERSADFPEFSCAVRARRTYPRGRFAAHVLGYTGRDRPDAAAAGAQTRFFEELEIRGRSGVELFYDGYLTGSPGERIVRVDARGFRKDEGRVVREPAHGPDLRLTLDPAIQVAMESALEGISGAGVAIDPRDGAVLAMASSPAFNPSEWAVRYRELLNDTSRPLLNRAVSGLYPPGSIFKPVTAAAAFRSAASGGLDWSPEEEYYCRGAFSLGNMRIHCWDRYGHGPVGLNAALEHSCNAYFCRLGHMLGTNSLFAAAREFGIGSRTGIDLGGEAEGTIGGEPWYAGTVCQTAIGQGKLQVTPLQMAVACAAFANGGKVFRPYLHMRSSGVPPARPVREIRLPPGAMDSIRGGMRDVVESGTGKRILWRYGNGRDRYRLKTDCAGKTGTAERGHGRKDTWVIAFAPFENPTVAIAMIVENGESGGKTAAPRIHGVLSAVFGEEDDA